MNSETPIRFIPRPPFHSTLRALFLSYWLRNPYSAGHNFRGPWPKFRQPIIVTVSRELLPVRNRSRGDRKPDLVPGIRAIPRSRNDRRRRAINTQPVTDSRPYVREAVRTDAHPASGTTVHLERSWRSLSLRTPNETNRDPDNNVALSTRAGAPTPQRRLGPTARTCVPIHYPNWLIEISRHWRGTDGYSFVRSSTYQGERTRPFDPVRSLRHIRARTYAFRQRARTTVRRGESSLPFNFVTYACSLNCFGCRRALRRSMRLCPHRRGNAPRERNLWDIPLSTLV